MSRTASSSSASWARGKSTVGTAPGRTAGLGLVDTDALVEERKRARRCRDIFRERGERAFQGAGDRGVLSGARQDGRGSVIATGGGAPAQDREPGSSLRARRDPVVPPAGLPGRGEGANGETDDRRPALALERARCAALYESRQPVYESLGRGAWRRTEGSPHESRRRSWGCCGNPDAAVPVPRRLGIAVDQGLQDRSRPSYSAFPRMTPVTSGIPPARQLRPRRLPSRCRPERMVGGRPRARRRSCAGCRAGQGAVPADVRVDEPPHTQGIEARRPLRCPRAPHPPSTRQRGRCPSARIHPGREPGPQKLRAQRATSCGARITTVPSTSRSTPRSSRSTCLLERAHAAAHLQAAGDVARMRSITARLSLPLPRPRPGPRCGPSARRRPRSRARFPRGPPSRRCVGVSSPAGAARSGRPAGRWRAEGARGSAARCAAALPLPEAALRGLTDVRWQRLREPLQRAVNAARMRCSISSGAPRIDQPIAVGLFA